MKKRQIKIGIIGAGRVGTTLGVLLKNQGYDVEIISKYRCNEISDSLLYDIAGDFGNISCLIPTFCDISKFSSKKDYIILAVRNMNIIDTIKSTLEYLKPGGAIVTIQNVYSIDILRCIPRNIMSIEMYIDFCCVYGAKNTVYVKNSAGITLGITDKNSYDKMNEFKEFFQGIMDVNITNDIVGFVASRNILSGAISVLGGVSGLHLGEILDKKIGIKLFNKLIKESLSVFKKLNIKVMPYNNRLDYYLFTDWSISGKIYNRKMISLLKKNNGEIKSSALYDCEHGKKTEINCVLSRLIKLGEKNGIRMPYSKALHSILTDIENKKLCISENVFKDIRIRKVNYDNR